ncbi:MAG: class I SAM-dependent methyltransferase [Bacteroides sp.]|nr:class I SAM-dependent methyltransferase [Bacteroides sp.]
MKENKYDDERFFRQYSQMRRSREGLQAAGEWHELQKLLPDFRGKRVLDLGCGFGWHCRYAVEQGALSVTGIDLSEKMLEVARTRHTSPRITYLRMAVEDFEYAPDTFDIVISSLTLHYVEPFHELCRQIHTCLTPGGCFVFSVEHPVFTAYGSQDWYYDTEGNILHWPVDSYFTEGKRTANFLGEQVGKYHKTLTTYLSGLLKNGFVITDLIEPQPDPKLLQEVEGMKDELRQPMMLLVAARKAGDASPCTM